MSNKFLRQTAIQQQFQTTAFTPRDDNAIKTEVIDNIHNHGFSRIQAEEIAEKAYDNVSKIQELLKGKTLTVSPQGGILVDGAELFKQQNNELVINEDALRSLEKKTIEQIEEEFKEFSKESRSLSRTKGLSKEEEKTARQEIFVNVFAEKIHQEDVDKQLGAETASLEAAKVKAAQEQKEAEKAQENLQKAQGVTEKYDAYITAHTATTEIKNQYEELGRGADQQRAAHLEHIKTHNGENPAITRLQGIIAKDSNDKDLHDGLYGPKTHAALKKYLDDNKQSLGTTTEYKELEDFYKRTDAILHNRANNDIPYGSKENFANLRNAEFFNSALTNSLNFNLDQIDKQQPTLTEVNASLFAAAEKEYHARNELIKTQPNGQQLVQKLDDIKSEVRYSQILGYETTGMSTETNNRLNPILSDVNTAISNAKQQKESLGALSQTSATEQSQAASAKQTQTNQENVVTNLHTLQTQEVNGASHNSYKTNHSQNGLITPIDDKTVNSAELKEKLENNNIKTEVKEGMKYGTMVKAHTEEVTKDEQHLLNDVERMEQLKAQINKDTGEKGKAVGDNAELKKQDFDGDGKVSKDEIRLAKLAAEVGKEMSALGITENLSALKGVTAYSEAAIEAAKSQQKS